MANAFCCIEVGIAPRFSIRGQPLSSLRIVASARRPQRSVVSKVAPTVGAIPPNSAVRYEYIFDFGPLAVDVDASICVPSWSPSSTAKTQSRRSISWPAFGPRWAVTVFGPLISTRVTG